MTSIRNAFHHDHRRLDTLFDELLNRMHVDDTAGAREAWTAFDDGLMAHLEAEEKFMIPIFEHRDPVEAQALLADHATIRALLAELGVMLEIHALRETKVEEFVGFLRAHAAREEAALYQWVDSDLPEAPKASILERLREARPTPRPRGRKLVTALGAARV